MVNKVISFQSLLIKNTLWLILLAAIFISISVGYMAWIFKLDTVKSAIQSISDQSANLINRDIEQTLKLLDIVNQYALSSITNSENIGYLLERIKEQDSSKYIELAWLDANGNSLVTSNPNNAVVSYQEELKKWYTNQNEYAISDTIFDSNETIPYIIIINPNDAQSNNPRYLVAKVSLRGFWSLFDPNKQLGISFGQTGRGLLLNHNFQTIGHSDLAKVYSFEVVPVQNKVNNSGEIHEGEYEDVFFSMKKIHLSPDKYWWLMVTLDKSEVYKSAYQTVATTLLILTIVTAILLYYTTRSAKILSKPIQNLCFGTKNIAEGDFSFRLNNRTNIAEAIELQDHFNDMASKLRDTLDKLTKADRLAALGTMASIVAHEIRNPLSSIVSFSIPLKKRVEEHDLEFVKDFDEVVPKELNRLNEILNEFLDFAKPQMFEFDKVDLNELITDTVRLMEVGLHPDQKIQTTLDTTIPIIHADKKKLRQVLINLGKNGLESIEQGHSEITFSTHCEQINGLKIVVIRVTDKGPGIPDKIKNSLFEPFQTTKRKGTGLGLAICQRIIEEHAGEIEVEVTGDTGTVFKITLSVKEDYDE